MVATHRIAPRVWLYPGSGGWHFATLPRRVAQKLREEAGPARGFGSIPVVATIGATSWKTSVFPDKRTGSFLLPIKASVREAEDIVAGRVAKIRLTFSPRRGG